MRFTIVAAAFVAPVAVAGPVTDAGPAADQRHVIDIDYWGEVTRTVGTTPHSVGDLIHGSMRIDTQYAPRDFEFDDESIGDYGINYTPGCDRNCDDENTEPSGFVTTPGILDRGGIVGDHVRLEDSASGDSLLLWDHEQGDRSADPYRLDELRIDVTSLQDFIHGDSLVQSFDLVLTDSDTGRGTRGGLTGAISNFFEFALGRIRATPRVCKP